MTFFDLIGHAAFALIAISFLVREILWLRILAVVSCIAGISYNYFVPTTPLWTPIIWNLIFIIVNLIQITIIINERRGVEFSIEEKELYQTVFKTFSPVEFMKLMRISKWTSVEKGTILIREKTQTENVALIYNGEVKIDIGGNTVARLKDGSFVGEMSFITGNLPSATVQTTVASRLVIFPKKELRDLLDRNPNMQSTMQGVFSTDLTKKLTHETEPVGA